MNILVIRKGTEIMVVTRMRERGYAFVLKQIARYLAGERLQNIRLHGY